MSPLLPTRVLEDLEGTRIQTLHKYRVSSTGSWSRQCSEGRLGPQTGEHRSPSCHFPLLLSLKPCLSQKQSWGHLKVISLLQEGQGHWGRQLKAQVLRQRLSKRFSRMPLAARELPSCPLAILQPEFLQAPSPQAPAQVSIGLMAGLCGGWPRGPLPKLS